MATTNYKTGDEIFKEYRCIRYLDEGGFGKVYLVENFVNLPYALKILHKDVNLEIRGIEAIKGIISDYLIKIIDYGKNSKDENCIVMEYIPDSLARKIMAGPISEKEALNYCIGILKGLKKLHDQGVIHRDIKPENLFILDNIKIGDFGTAKYTSGQSEMTAGIGTIAYMAPETFDDIYGFQADLWSTGVVIFKMLSGKLPFEGKSRAGIFGAIMQKEPDLSIVPNKFNSFFKKCFKKSPEERYQNVEEMQESLEICVIEILFGLFLNQCL
ncbi:MAG: serine/threonine protein kinase [Desulfobacterales bacterium]|nr:serine/threonine protein kinase [Desulfobacterales bacterium]